MKKKERIAELERQLADANMAANAAIGWHARQCERLLKESDQLREAAAQLVAERDHALSELDRLSVEVRLVAAPAPATIPWTPGVPWPNKWTTSAGGTTWNS